VIRRITWLAWTAFIQLVRTRVYLNILVAGVALVVAALAFDQLSAGEGGRVLFDIGTSFTALVVAALSGTIAITAVTRELETKQAHLVLARSIGRAEFVVARFLTTALLVVLSNLVLGALLTGLMIGIAADKASLALAACLFASFEGFIVAAVAIFFGVGSSSTMSAVFTTTIFVLGRLTGEMQEVIAKQTFRAATPALRAIWFVLPHLPAFDLTGIWHGDPVDAGALATSALYGIAYTVAILAAAAFRFSRRDLL
jgi:ABC-type transport system involved in multi-copper enzyme maturation permease subunit